MAHISTKIVPAQTITNRAGTGKNIHRNYTGERNGSQMPDYISAMDIDEIVEYILYFDIGTECDNFEE